MQISEAAAAPPADLDKSRLQLEARLFRDALGENLRSKWKMLISMLWERGFEQRYIRMGPESLQQCEAAFSQCDACLTENGHVLLGWDDIPHRTPVALTRITSLARLRKYTFPALGTWRYLTDTPNRHTYDFYRKHSPPE
jgi:hypothetical protein